MSLSNPYLESYHRLNISLETPDPENSILLAQQLGLASQAYTQMVKDMLRLNCYLIQCLKGNSNDFQMTSVSLKDSKNSCQGTKIQNKIFESVQPRPGADEEIGKYINFDQFKKQEPKISQKKQIANKKVNQSKFGPKSKGVGQNSSNNINKTLNQKLYLSTTKDIDYQDDIQNSHHKVESVRSSNSSFSIGLTRYTMLSNNNLKSRKLKSKNGKPADTPNSEEEQYSMISSHQQKIQMSGDKNKIAGNMEQEVISQFNVTTHDEDGLSNVFQYRLNQKHKPDGAILNRVKCLQCQAFYDAVGLREVCECSSRHKTSAEYTKVYNQNSQQFDDFFR